VGKVTKQSMRFPPEVSNYAASREAMKAELGNVWRKILGIPVSNYAASREAMKDRGLKPLWSKDSPAGFGKSQKLVHFSLAYCDYLATNGELQTL
jgi:hypothetical protein